MFNGHWIAAGAFIKAALPIQEWIKIAVVATVTAVVTSQITLARLDERINGMKAEIAEIKRDVDKIEIGVTDIRVQIARRIK